MRIIAALAVFTGLAACALPPEGTDEQDAANYNAALASIGCDLRTEGDYQAMEIQTGLARPTLAEMTSYKLQTEDLVQLSDGGVRLVTGACAAGGAGAEAAA